MSYIGDLTLGSTFDVKFCTVNTSGAPTTLAGVPVVSAYVDNSLTEITAGITLSVDFDARTGLHNVRIVATGANGYAAGGNYQLVITTGTVGGTSVVGYVVAQFSIEARSALRPTTSGRTLDVSAGGEGGIDWANVGSPATVVGLSGTTVKTATDVETDTVDIQGRLPAALVGGRMRSDAEAISADAVAADNLETMLDGTGGQKLTLAQLNIVAAVNDSAIVASGAGTGHGIAATGGATGTGIRARGGSTSGAGMDVAGDGGGAGLLATGGGFQPGLRAVGGQNVSATLGESGAKFEGTLQGSGLRVIANDTGNGLLAEGGLNATGSGIRALALGAGDGIEASSNGGGLDIDADLAGSVLSIATAGIAATSFAAGAINAAAIAADAIGASELAADAANEIADALLDRTNGVETGVTVRQSLRLANAANGGKVDGAATATLHVRDLADTKNRVTATVDADGNRTTVTRDLT